MELVCALFPKGCGCEFWAARKGMLGRGGRLSARLRRGRGGAERAAAAAAGLRCAQRCCLGGGAARAWCGGCAVVALWRAVAALGAD